LKTIQSALYAPIRLLSQTGLSGHQNRCHYEIAWEGREGPKIATAHVPAAQNRILRRPCRSH